MRAPARSSLFNTVPQRDYLQFWQSGLFQPQRVARFLGLSKSELARLAGVAPASVRFDDKAPRILRERIMDLAATCELVAEALEGNTTKTALWFMTPNPELNNSSPCDLLRRGDREVLQRQILDAIKVQVPVAPVPRPKQGRALLDSHRQEIIQLCQRYAVRHLSLFGSALRTDFEPGRSDIDLAVEFAPSLDLSPARQYFNFKGDLEQLLHCRVDLVELASMPESRLRRTITRTQVPIYGEAGRPEEGTSG
jgi:uncharacterized protein